MGDRDTARNTARITAALTPIEQQGVTDEDACLVVIVGQDIGKKYTLSMGNAVIGRAPRCEIHIDDGSISRQHAAIARTSDGYVLKDLGSTNGTMLNTDYVKSAHLEDGALIRIGRTVLKFLSGDNVESEYYAEIYRLTTTDGLTQAYNKRYLFEYLERELSRALRYQRQLSIIMIDIDHFKSFNDDHGHLAGDSVLRDFCGRVNSVIRRSDTLARYGGEEFALIAPETSLTFASQVAEKVRQAIALEPFDVEGQKIRVTASFGVADIAEYAASFPGGVEAARTELPDPKLLIGIADKKLYRAKRDGRNRVIS